MNAQKYTYASKRRKSQNFPVSIFPKEVRRLPGHGAYLRTLQRILHGDESLHRERHYEPDAQTGAHRRNVDQHLAPSLPVEDVQVVGAQVDHHQHHQEAEVGHRQRRQVVAGAACLERRRQEDDAREQVAHQPHDYYEGDVVDVQHVEVGVVGGTEVLFFLLEDRVATRGEVQAAVVGHGAAATGCECVALLRKPGGGAS